VEANELNKAAPAPHEAEETPVTISM